jgi:hypothetical protein
MKCYYFDVLNTGENLGVAMPHLSALCEKVERYPVNKPLTTETQRHSAA